MSNRRARRAAAMARARASAPEPAPRGPALEPRARRDRHERDAFPSPAWVDALAIVVVLQVAVLVLYFDTSAFEVFDQSKAIVSHGLSWLLLAVLMLAALSSGLAVPRSLALAALGAVVVADVLTTVLARDRYVAAFGDLNRYLGLTTQLGYALLVIAVMIVVRDGRSVVLTWGIGVVTLAVIAYGYVQWTGGDPVKWIDVDPRQRPFSSLGNADFFGQLLAVIVVVALGLIAFASRGRRRDVWPFAIPFFLVSFALLLIVSTRGALVGVVLGALGVALLWVRRAGMGRRDLLRTGALVAIGAVVLGGVTALTPIGKRFAEVLQGVGIEDRLLIFGAALGMFRDHVLFGVGLENFAVAFGDYRPERLALLLTRDLTPTSAHDWVLQIAATTGLVGLVTQVAFLGLALLVAWRVAAQERALPALLGAVALVAFYGAGLVLPGSQSIQWVPWVASGAILGVEWRRAAPLFALPRQRLGAIAIGVLAALISLPALAQFNVYAASRAEHLADLSLRTDVRGSIDQGQRAVEFDPGRAVYWNTLGRALEATGDAAGARDAYTEATNRAPNVANFWTNLGRINLLLLQRGVAGAKEASLAATNHAIAVDPNNSDPYDVLAKTQFQFGDYAAALASERRAIALYPRDPSFYAVAAECTRRLGDNDGAFDLLRAGAAATDSNDLRLTLARGLISVGRYADARVVLNEVLARQANNPTALDLLKQIAGR